MTIFDEITEKARSALIDAADAEPRYEPLPWAPECFPAGKILRMEEKERWLAALHRRQDNAQTREPALAEFVIATVDALLDPEVVAVQRDYVAGLDPSKRATDNVAAELRSRERIIARIVSNLEKLQNTTK